MTFAIVLIGWIFSLCLHEFGHAIVAYYGGDKTVKDKGIGIRKLEPPQRW